MLSKKKERKKQLSVIIKVSDERREREKRKQTANYSKIQLKNEAKKNKKFFL